MNDIEFDLRNALMASRPSREPDEAFTSAVEKRLRAARRSRVILLALLTLAAGGLGVALIMSAATVWAAMPPVAAGSLTPGITTLSTVSLCLLALLLLAPLFRQPK